jgi:hypothetical protein
MAAEDLELWVTLCPTFGHYPRFVGDDRIKLIRINSAMLEVDELTGELETEKAVGGTVPRWFDVKGRQLRVKESIVFKDHLEVVLNHPIEVQTPTWALFKAGEDPVMLAEVRDGVRLIFDGGPKFNVRPGESLHIRHPSLTVGGDVFTDFELKKIELAKSFGFRDFFLSYVQQQSDIDQLRELIGKDARIIAKIEDKKGLEFAAKSFKKQPGVSLMAAICTSRSTGRIT